MDTAVVRRSVDEGNRKFGAAAARKDYAGMAGLYTENAKVLPPDAPIISGRKAIEEFWRTAANALGLTDVTLKTIDLEITRRYCLRGWRGRPETQLRAGKGKISCCLDQRW